jgi:predicted ATP-grasp superfamily ATP-dependent carboligase
MKERDLSVLIVDGESDFALFVARCLAQVPDLELHVLSSQAWVPLRFSRHRRTYRYRARGNSDEQRLDVIRQAVEQTGADIILPVDESAVHFVSAHRQSVVEMAALPPIPEPEAFETVVNKWSLAQFLRENGIPGPATILYTADDEFKRNLRDLQFPVLIKPARARGGEGIQRFDTPSGLMGVLSDIVATSSYQYIVQSFVRGYNVDCSALCDDGRILAHTIQRGFVAGSQSFAASAGIDFIRHDQVLDVIGKLISAVKFSGIVHVDLRYDRQEQQAKIIDVNARYWGSLIGSLVVGVNFPHLACLAALGVDFPSPDYQLGRYVASGAAVKQGLRKLLGRSELEFTFEQTSLPYALGDPIAEVVKLAKQALFEHR